MMNTDNSQYTQNTEKFLFFMNSNLATEFCCGCTLKLGVIIISIVKLVMYLSQMISLSSSTYLVTVYSLQSVADLVAMGLLFYSTISRRVDLAFWGYIIVAVLLYFRAFMCVLSTILLIFLSGSLPYGYYGYYYYYIIIIIVMFIVVLALEYYFTYIIYSFTRYITLGNWNAIEGDFSGIDNNIKAQLNSQGNNNESSMSANPQNTQENSMYSGPQNNLNQSNQGNQQEMVVQGQEVREVRMNNTGNSNQNVVSLDVGMKPMTNASASVNINVNSNDKRN